jgi:hypothetical protein
MRKAPTALVDILAPIGSHVGFVLSRREVESGLLTTRAVELAEQIG